MQRRVRNGWRQQNFKAGNFEYDEQAGSKTDSKNKTQKTTKKPQNQMHKQMNTPSKKKIKKDGRKTKTSNSNEKTWKFTEFFWKQQLQSLTSMGAPYQEGFVPFLFCGPRGMRGHCSLAFLMQNLGWEQCGPWVCLESCLFHVLTGCHVPWGFFLPSLLFSLSWRIFFISTSMWEIPVLTNMNTVSGKGRKC